ncbi:hypothetical protein KP509_34G029600 [Ceratopteris richardii]|uniref:PHD-type domain-containing protein n=1 Tax=Ceratopteris richardii TaxID=49495 RepID=A0A8T2QK34_CERRI|nr:hypothetical protein KP509_34G029600 [Ceratopteris richardii]
MAGSFVEIPHCMLQKLRTEVENLGGKFEDGWEIYPQRLSNDGSPNFIFISPTKERFSSRLEVLRHLGLPGTPVKKLLEQTGLEIVPLELQNKFPRKLLKAKGILHRKYLKKHKSTAGEGKIPASKKAAKNLQVSNLSSSMIASEITQHCQDILQSIVSTESFANLSNMICHSSSSVEATLQLKGSSFPVSLMDLNLLHLRLSTGAYGQNPELFSADIQQVWKNIITAGNELVHLASSLAEHSESLFKEQVMDMFAGSPRRIMGSTDNKEPFDDGCVHEALPERVLARDPEDMVWKELPADHFVKNGIGLRGLPASCETAGITMAKNFISMKSATKASNLLGNKLQTDAWEAKEYDASQDGQSHSGTENTCQKCGLHQGEEYVVCDNCKAKYHSNCVVPNPTAGLWSCPLCLLNQAPVTQDDYFLMNSSGTTEVCHDLQDITRKWGMCKVCEKEDDKVLLCDACDTAYHMHCLAPPIDSIPEGYWYCSACDEPNKRVVVYEQNCNVHNCAVCERVSRELLNCAENESTAQVFSKETSLLLGPQPGIDNAYPEQSFDQVVSMPCIENKAMDPDSLDGAGICCKVCGLGKVGKLGKVKKIVLCSNCGNCYHWACVKPAIKKQPRKPWYCASCLCRVCNIDVDDDNIILCDGCDEGSHIYCLTPPISDIPNEAWYCPCCIEARQNES